MPLKVFVSGLCMFLGATWMMVAIVADPGALPFAAGITAVCGIWWLAAKANAEAEDKPGGERPRRG